ncbi:MAG: hypothetical protein KatS3mg110_4163 [Pirellulaceae bacterium]|nr:MAG: hypothetical protein KatS3mg110_4163 [Pirellulaceae bacterium]
MTAGLHDADVLIVGGGPAGSSCAWALVRAGLRVTVLDKASFPRDKPCAGWITPQIVTAVELDVEQYRQGRVWQPVYGFRCGMIGGPEIAVRYQEPISFGIRRCEFDTYLLQRSGARLVLNCPVRRLERHGTRWVINEQWTAPMLVGAGGHFCPVARQLDARRSCRPLVTAQEVEYRAPPEVAEQSQVEPDMPEIFFCQDLKGYGWCFRKELFFNVGLGRLDAQHLPAHVSEFCQELAKRGKVPASFPVAFRGHAYVVYEQVAPRLVDEGVVLVGDAAGLAYGRSGEGIRPAVESGLLAARTIMECQGDFSAKNLEAYTERITERFGRPRPNRRWLPDSWLCGLARWLLQQRWFARHVVMDRWFLHRQQPPLVNLSYR